MKIKFQVGSNAKRSFKFDTSSIPKGEARNFTEDALKIVADAAKAIKDRIEDYENVSDNLSDSDSPKESARAQDFETETQTQTETETQTQTQTQTYAETADENEPDPQPESSPQHASNSPCAETLASLDLGDREISWIQLGDSSAALIRLLDGEDQVQLWRRVQDAVNPAGCHAVLVDGDTADYLESDLKLVPETGADERFSLLRAAVYAQYEPHSLPDPLSGSYGHSSTERRFGRAPSEEELLAAQVTTESELDEYLWRWERETFGDEEVLAKADPANISWYEADDTFLLVLPVADGASVVRSLGFWPTDDRPDWVQALGNDIKIWEQEFGAELVANYGTMLQFVVSRPPTDLDTAYQLATEHDIVGGATLPPPGIQRRHYAADLVNQNRWHLHDRP